MSLTMVTVADACFVGSATLCAVTTAVGGTGKFAGAEYTPAALIVPLLALPPLTPFTLQETLVSRALLTVATNVCVFPNSTEALPGVTATLTDGVGVGGGEVGGGTKAVELAVPPAQPSRHALAASSARYGTITTRLSRGQTLSKSTA